MSDSTLLPMATYKKVLKTLEHYKKQDDEDRAENPKRIPIDWKSSILQSIEEHIRNDHVSRSGRRDLAVAVLAYLVKQGKLVEYHGGVAFPGRELPTRDEIVEISEEAVRRMYGGPKL